MQIESQFYRRKLKCSRIQAPIILYSRFYQIQNKNAPDRQPCSLCCVRDDLLQGMRGLSLVWPCRLTAPPTSGWTIWPPRSTSTPFIRFGSFRKVERRERRINFKSMDFFLLFMRFFIWIREQIVATVSFGWI